MSSRDSFIISRGEDSANGGMSFMRRVQWIYDKVPWCVWVIKDEDKDKDKDKDKKDK